MIGGIASPGVQDQDEGQVEVVGDVGGVENLSGAAAVEAE